MTAPRLTLIYAVAVMLAIWITPATACAQSAPKWAVGLAVAAPMADGLTTWSALQRHGVREGNPIYGSASANRILGLKVGQAVAQGLIVRAIGKRTRKGAIVAAVVPAVVYGVVSVRNLRAGR